MKVEIKNRFNGSILFALETYSIKLCLEAAIKSRANLSRANLSRAYLYGANLYGANLSRADLSGANLSGANLYGANLYEANLSRADLSRANLSRADLSEADLYGADLSGADLSGANLSGANLYEANLSGANLSKGGLDPKNKPNMDWKGFKSLNKEWVIGYRTRETSAAGKILVDDRIYGCEVFSTLDTECHPGWYLWPTLEQSKNFSGSDKEFVKVKSRKCDIHKAGSKWRSRAIWVIGTVK